MAHIDALFLDFDGVLVESVDLKAAAFQALYADQPQEVQDRIMAYHAAQDGISRVVKISHCHKHILGQSLSQALLDSLAADYCQKVEDAVVKAPWVPGAKEFLQTHHPSHKLFVVSGTPEEEIKRIAESRGMMAWLTEVRGSPAAKADIVRALMAKYDLRAEHCLFIGDAMADWQAAEETGMDFLGRVAPGHPSPFPNSTQTVADLCGLRF